MKIYTKTGDRGQTALFGGERVSKANARVEAYGEVDELNSILGLARAERFDDELDELLARLQSQLFTLGAELATPPDSKADLGIVAVSDADVALLEQAIDKAESELEPLKTFILPGGSRSAATLHLARTVCRRAERSLVRLAQDEPVRDECVRYLNRLSDALFVFGRLANLRAGVRDVPWKGAARHGE